MNCEEGETNINGINNDSIVGQSASKIDPTQCAVMSGEKWMPRKFQRKILVGVTANSWRFCLHLPLSLLLSSPLLSSPLLFFQSLATIFVRQDKDDSSFPPNKISSRLIEVGKERDATFVLALTHMLSIQVAQTKGDGKLIYLVEASYLFPMTRVQGTGLH